MVRDELILSFLDNAKYIARNIYHSFGTVNGFELEDVESEAFLGLVRCASVFNDSLGVPFPAYATIKIRWHLHDFYRKANPLTAGHRRAIKSGECAPVVFMSLDIEADNEMKMARYMADPRSHERLRDNLERADLSALIRRSGLTRGEAVVARGTACGETQESMAKILSVADSRVSQLYKAACIKMGKLNNRTPVPRTDYRLHNATGSDNLLP